VNDAAVTLTLNADNSATFAGSVTIGTGVINPSLGGDIAITQGAIGLRLNDAASAISPSTATSNNDNAVDLGVSNIRFRNLYMGGNGTFGGNVGIGSANADSKLKVELNPSGTVLAGLRIGYNSTSANYFDGDTQHFRNGAGTTERLRIDSSGRVGIGGINPSQQLELGGILSPALKLSSTTTNGGVIIFNVAGADKGFFGSGYHLGTGSSNDTAMRGEADLVFLSGGNNQRMRITSGGDVLFRGTSVPSASNLVGSGFKFDSKSRMTLVQTSDNNNLTDLQEYFNTDGAVGKIQTNGTATLFTTSSDYRLKEDLQKFNGLEKVSNIKVYDFKWKTNGRRSYGVMAHELQEVLPQAVGGEKNAIKENGEINTQTVDYSKIVPLLVKSIQELKAEVDLLKQECKCKN
jgi:hypothetical protein